MSAYGRAPSGLLAIPKDSPGSECQFLYHQSQTAAWRANLSAMISGLTSEE
jgi:hypothetical protein